MPTDTMVLEEKDDDGPVQDVSELSEDLLAMCERIGMDVQNDLEDMKLLWIAEQALSQPLPNGWSEFATEEGFAYFHNAETNETQWEPPMTKHFINLYARLKLESKRATEDTAQTGDGTVGNVVGEGSAERGDDEKMA